MAFFQTDNLWVNELGDGVAELMLGVAGSKVNHLGVSALHDSNEALKRVEKEKRFRLMFVRSAKDAHFAAGPGIEELAGFRTSEDFVEVSRLGQEVLERLAKLPVPTVALIAGGCQGGGLELALACDYRVAVDVPATRFSFQEQELGLMPAWGGTVRLPRAIGLERSLQMLLGERQLSALSAFDWGLVDVVIGKGEANLPEFIQEPSKRTFTKLPLRTWRQRLMEGMAGARLLVYRGTERLLKRRLPDDLPAAWEVFEAVRAGLEKGAETAYERERAGIGRLSQSDAFRNLLRLQLARKRIRHERFPGKQAKHIRQIALVGAGNQGSQLATLAVTRGCHIVVREANESALGMAMFRVLSLFQNSLGQGRVTKADIQRHLGNINGTTAWKGFAEADLVIESAEANADGLRALMREIEENSGAKALLVSASGWRSLAELRGELKEPGRLAGLRFAEPVSRGSVVEVIGDGLSEERLRELGSWVVRMGCLPVVVHDRPGHVVERVWLAAIHEAILLLQEDMPFERIEESMQRFGIAQGPLARADQIGSARLEHLAASLPNRFGKLAGFFALMSARGWLGQASRQGFYFHLPRRRPRPNRLIAKLAAPGFGGGERVATLSRRDQLELCEERIVVRTINEAAWCLEEGAIDRAEDLDVAMAGTGWAPHRGGPLAYAQQQGVEDVRETLEDLAKGLGERFAPSAWLGRLGSPK